MKYFPHFCTFLLFIGNFAWLLLSWIFKSIFPFLRSNNSFVHKYWFFDLGYWNPVNKTFCFEDRADILRKFWVRLGPILPDNWNFLWIFEFLKIFHNSSQTSKPNPIEQNQIHPSIFQNIKIYWKIAIDKKIGKISNKKNLAAENL